MNAFLSFLSENGVPSLSAFCSAITMFVSFYLNRRMSRFENQLSLDLKRFELSNEHRLSAYIEFLNSASNILSGHKDPVSLSRMESAALLAASFFGMETHAQILKCRDALVSPDSTQDEIRAQLNLLAIHFHDDYFSNKKT